MQNRWSPGSVRIQSMSIGDTNYLKIWISNKKITGSWWESCSWLQVYEWLHAPWQDLPTLMNWNYLIRSKQTGGIVHCEEDKRSPNLASIIGRVVFQYQLSVTNHQNSCNIWFKRQNDGSTLVQPSLNILCHCLLVLGGVQTDQRWSQTGSHSSKSRWIIQYRP